MNIPEPLLVPNEKLDNIMDGINALWLVSFKLHEADDGLQHVIVEVSARGDDEAGKMQPIAAVLGTLSGIIGGILKDSGISSGGLFHPQPKPVKKFLS
jgi:hypothetical protein